MREMFLRGGAISIGKDKATIIKSVFPELVDQPFKVDVDGLYIHVDDIDEYLKEQQADSEEIPKHLKDAMQAMRKFVEVCKGQVSEDEEKPTFPNIEDIEWIMVEAPEWLEQEGISGFFNGVVFGNKYTDNHYHHIKSIYENSSDLTVKWKLKQKQCTGELNGYYVEASKEAYDKLVELGYYDIDKNFYGYKYFLIENNKFDGRNSIIKSIDEYKQMWLHNNEFVFENPDRHAKREPLFKIGDSVTTEDLYSGRVIGIADEGDLFRYQIRNGGGYIREDCLSLCPHAELRKEYEEALERGEIVKVEVFFESSNEWKEWGFDFFNKDDKYRLKYYEIDFAKLPTGTEVKVSENGLHWQYLGYLYIGYLHGLHYVSFQNSTSSEAWTHCRLPEGTPIKNEWLKEKTK